MRAIIFDFDGTLADSFKTMVEIGHELTHRPQLAVPEEVAMLRNSRLLDAARTLKIPRWRWPILLIRGRAKMRRRMHEIQPFSGMAEVLAALHKDGYQLYIMTSNSRSNVQDFLVRHGYGDYFTQIYGGVGIFGKGRALRQVLKKNNLLPTEAIYVGDELRDIEGSKQVGMPCVAVAWGFNSPELLSEHAPMFVVRTTTQLQRVLEDWGSTLS